jgi:hypothetical protein
MNLQTETRPHQGNDADRVQGCSYLAGRNVENSRDCCPRKQAENQLASAIVAASNCRLTADLLGESMEFAVAYAAAVLRAVREADDAAAIAHFHDFDAAARCARKCATELRSLLQVGGAR